MATDNSRGQAFSACAASHPSDAEAEGATPFKPLFSRYEPFPEALDNKLIPGSALRLMASSVYRIAGGCQVVVEMLAQEASDDARRLTTVSPEAPTLLGAFDRGQLHSLVSGSLHALTREVEQLVEWAIEHCADRR